jgi:hypothetical protein
VALEIATPPMRVNVGMHAGRNAAVLHCHVMSWPCESLPLHVAQYVKPAALGLWATLVSETRQFVSSLNTKQAAVLLLRSLPSRIDHRRLLQFCRFHFPVGVNAALI